jgi:predicted dehydrogenase
MKLCVIGCGGMSTGVHGPSYVKYAAAYPDLERAACCDLNLEAAEKYRRRFGFARAYTDAAQMLDIEQPDAVTVLVSEAASCAVGLLVLKRGIPMLTEKPPGKTSAETRRLAQAAWQQGTPCMVAFNRRYIPLLQTARQWVAECSAPVQYVGYDFFRERRNDADFSDTAVHAIDTTRLLCGAEYACADFAYQNDPAYRPRNVCISAQAKNGAMARIHLFPHCGVTVERATIHCGEHTFFIHLPIDSQYDGLGSVTEISRSKVLRRAEGKDIPDGDERYINSGFYKETEQFLNAVRAGKLDCRAFDDALQIMEIKETYAAGLPHWEAGK